MNLSTKRRTSVAAFSLVEVALATGIAGFCLLAVFGLVPLGVSTGQTASDQIAASSILTHVLADLRATPMTSPPGGAATSLEYKIALGVQKTLYFGSAVGSAGQQFSASTTLANTSRYRLTVTFPPSAGGRTATYVTLLVSWPASLDPSNLATGRVQTLAVLDRN